LQKNEAAKGGNNANPVHYFNFLVNVRDNQIFEK